MARQISQRELRNDSGKIMRALTEGEQFVITRNGEPVGELLPMRRRRFVRVEAITEIFANAPAVDGERLRSDLDAIVDQDITPNA